MHSITVRNNAIESIKKGCPWLFSNALLPLEKPIANGTLVTIKSTDHKPLAIGYYNSRTKIACRILSTDTSVAIDEAFFIERFSKALQYRNKLFSKPYYRLIHAEGDRLPGLIIDRYDSVLVCQTTTLGMETLKDYWLKALIQVLNPQTVIFKDDTAVRQTEGLETHITLAYGEAIDDINVLENDQIFSINPMDGQKTGWFFDQRANRAWVKQQAKDKSVLDLYTYCGGFGIQALGGGARSVTFVDRSADAVNHIEKSLLHFPNQQHHCIKANVYSFLDETIEQGKHFELVIADPPAFIKSKADKGSGLRGYQKLARLCAQVVSKNGILLIASCSHHASLSEFKKEVLAGIQKSGRTVQQIYQGEADKDHPVHPQLKQTRYLKALGFKFLQ